MTKPLLAILLLLPLSVSAGELDGKGLVCQLTVGFFWDGYHQEIHGFKFVKGEAQGERLVISEEQLEHSRLAPFDSKKSSARYSTYPTKVSWWGEYTLNRQTLALAWERSEKSWGGVTTSTEYGECEVFQTLKSYADAFSRYAEQELEKINEEMKDNKI